MEKELDPVVIKATQTSLGKYVKRPPLTDKLLKKPPFRFLHDIVTCVLNTTGFFEGLFDQEELVSENVKERENKIAFLNKVITVVGWTTGKSLSVKPSKIVAGQEPDKTNELLQCIAHALDKKLSSDDAVKKFKDGTKASKADDKKAKDTSRSVKKPTENNKLVSKSNEKLTSQKKESTITRASSKNDIDKTNSKTKQKEKNLQKNEPAPKKTQSQSSKSTSKKAKDKQQEKSNDNHVTLNRVKNDVSNNGSIEDMDEIVQNADEVQLVEPSLTTAENNIEDREQQNLNSSYTIVDNVLNSSLSSQDLMDTEVNKTQEPNEEAIKVESSLIMEQDIDSVEKNIDNTQKSYEEDNKELLSNGNKIVTDSIQSNLEKIEEKPDSYPSIIKSPSKVKIARPLSVRPSSSRPGAPRPRDKHDNILVEAENVIVGKVNIIAENAANEEEEDTSLIITEQEKNIPEVSQDEREKLQASLNEHGHLVQQILDSQKEYSQMSGKTEIEWQFGAKKARDALNKEIEQLRFDIQALSRVSNPLGKLLDHIQEDVEVMRQELHQWTNTFEDASKELSIQKTANEEYLYPLKLKVRQLDTDILEKHDKISDLKIIIHKNSQRIEKLLQNGNVQ